MRSSLFIPSSSSTTSLYCFALELFILCPLCEGHLTETSRSLIFLPFLICFFLFLFSRVPREVYCFVLSFFNAISFFLLARSSCSDRRFIFFSTRAEARRVVGASLAWHPLCSVFLVRPPLRLAGRQGGAGDLGICCRFSLALLPECSRTAESHCAAAAVGKDCGPRLA